MIAIGCATFEEFVLFQTKQRSVGDYEPYTFVNHPADCYGNVFEKAIVLPSFMSLKEQEIVYDVLLRHIVGRNEDLIDDRRSEYVSWRLEPEVPSYTPTYEHRRQRRRKQFTARPEPPKEVIPDPPKQEIIIEATKPEIEMAKKVVETIGLLVCSVEQYQRFRQFFPNGKTYCLMRLTDLDNFEILGIKKVTMCGTYWSNPDFDKITFQLKLRNIPAYIISGKLVAL